jgi:Putative peptidoglycan binding domain
MRREAVRSSAMEGREQHDPGYDDWFDEPEPATETQGDAARSSYDSGDEVWVLPEDDEPRHTGRREIVVAGRTLTLTQVAIIAGSFIVLLIAILAAAGVFSSSKAPTPAVTTPTTPPAPKTTSTVTTTTTPTVTAPSQTLSPGATGSEVKALQQSLASLGYDPGTPDGNYGPSTQAAVEKFQAANGLATDGVVGAETLAKLQQALSG